MSSFHFNIIPFQNDKKQVEMRFITQERKGWERINVSQIPDEAQTFFTIEDDTKPYVYTDFLAETTDDPNVKMITIDLDENKTIARLYYTSLIQDYFKRKADIVNYNFLKDTEVWIFDSTDERYSHHFDIYKKFTLRVQYDWESTTPELLVTYEGTSKVLKESLMDLIEQNVPSELFNKVVNKGRILKFHKCGEWINGELESTYAVLRRELQKELKIPFQWNGNGNKYKNYLDEVKSFISNYLNTGDFLSIINHDCRMKSIPGQQVCKTSYGSNKLVFKDGYEHINPYLGMRNAKGPYKPASATKVKVFFILHEEMKDLANEFHMHLAGKKQMQSLSQFCKLPINYDQDKFIIFQDNENPLPEIRQKLSEMVFDKDTSYLAYYLTDIPKEEDEWEKFTVYHKVKEELLKKNITSQVVHIRTIKSSGFKYSATNIAIATLAKLGGIPWRLDRPKEDELIIGVGAFKSELNPLKFIGSAFAFSNDGQFQEFESFPETEMFHLTRLIKEAIREFKAKRQEVKRLVIHFYKTINTGEVEKIQKALEELDIGDIPIVVVTVNKTESRDIVVFDADYNEAIPLSGTYVPIGQHSYLLCNNTRYNGREVDKKSGYPLPVKLHLWASDERIINDSDEVQKLIDQVYQFSRMYWKSVSQQNLPVTTKYPELLAQIVPFFNNGQVPPYGKQNLWFL